MKIDNFGDLGGLVQAKQSTKKPHHNSAKKAPTQAVRSTRQQIFLCRKIEVKCWRVVGDVATAKRRPELLTVLQRANELKNGTDAADAAAHLLFESVSRRAVAQRLINIAKLYGLLEEREKRYFLTELGADALKVKQVFIPEHGTWTVWASKDPLLEQPILRVEPWREPTAYDEVRGKEKQAVEKRTFESLPNWLLEYEGVATAPPASGGGGQLILQGLERKAESVADTNASLMVEWDVSGETLSVKGRVAGTEVDSTFSAEKDVLESVWIELLHREGMNDRWDADAAALRLKFHEVDLSERESMRRDMGFSSPSFGSLGVFDPMVVHDVPLQALTDADAQDWAVWRLEQRVRDYATMSRYSSWVDEAAMPFSEFVIDLPDRDSLAEKLWQARQGRPSSVHWNLLAAKDWGL
ncbi:hypothetical protein [Dechloromonas sp.]|uniref:hypothetical protein n=1 Tax=Dechloromonas sp. TaxID=1917218 RepID=UPI00216B69E9|nr:hypothetical protein [Dechloromonas sp.]MBU3695591.1 hypothetical protein [Dechloromonas sp.]